MNHCSSTVSHTVYHHYRLGSTAQSSAWDHTSTPTCMLLWLGSSPVSSLVLPSLWSSTLYEHVTRPSVHYASEKPAKSEIVKVDFRYFFSKMISSLWGTPTAAIYLYLSAALPGLWDLSILLRTLWIFLSVSKPPQQCFLPSSSCVVSYCRIIFMEKNVCWFLTYVFYLRCLRWFRVHNSVSVRRFRNSMAVRKCCLRCSGIFRRVRVLYASDSRNFRHLRLDTKEVYPTPSREAP